MRHLCVLGLQWGDEGKGKIVDVLTADVDAVVRYQGGANAGHTIWVGEERHVFHHLPSGILRPEVAAVLGNGMVVEPAALLEEVDRLSGEAVARLHLSERAHVVLPHHLALDAQREREAAEESAGGPAIGTTLRGIGPAYQDKISRRGVRLGDLCRPGFAEEELAERLAARGVDGPAVTRAVELCTRLRERLGGRVQAVDVLLERWHEQGKRFLFEGAQGSLLDIDFGTYPFVTCSTPSFLGLGPGSGFSPRRIDHVIGVSKVYCTRVGEGPFPSELHGADAEPLRAAGDEFGATTGRPRRCGWLDLPALAFACRINDVDSIALTKADILAGRERVPVVVDYRGVATEGYPLTAADLAAAAPVVEEWPGWREPTVSAMAPFVERLEGRLEVPVSLVSTGRRRDELAARGELGLELQRATRR